ncbi:MAG: histidine kinase [Caldilineaceae bacterium]
MQDYIKHRLQGIDWLQIIFVTLFLITATLTIWAAYEIQLRACRINPTIASENIDCPTILEDLSPLAVAIGFILLSVVPWLVDRQFLPTIYFMHIASILAVGIGTLDNNNDITSRLFNILLAFFAPTTFHIHLHLLLLSVKSYRKFILISLYGLAVLVALPFFLWTTAIQDSLGYTYVFRRNIRIVVLVAFLIVIIVGIFEYRNRHLLSVRGKIRLITFGTVFAFIPMLLLSMLPEILSGSIYVPYTMTFPGLLFSPLTYIYSIFRHKFVAIENFINRAVIYYMLVILLIGIYIIAINVFNSFTSIAVTLSISNITLNILLLLSFPLLYTGLLRFTNWVLYGGEINYTRIQEELSESLSLILDQKQLKLLMLEEVPSRLRLTGGFLFLLNDADELHCVGTKGFSVPEEYSDLQLTNSPLIDYMEKQAKPIHAQMLSRMFARQVQDEPEEFLFSIKTLSYWVPLISGNILQGVLILSIRQDSDFLTAHDFQILKILTHASGIAAYNTRLIKQAAQHQKDLTKAHQQILINREHDQQRIAHELHDNAVQQIIGVSYQLTALHRRAVQREEISSESIEIIRSELSAVSASLREVIGELRPAGLKELGITNALQGYLARLKRIKNNIPTIEVALDEDTSELSESLSVCLFRVTQESVQNAIKHAYATTITIALRIRRGKARLTIRDNGCGFKVPVPLSELAQRDHYGLVNMSERVHLVNGTFEVTSAPGIGTSVKVVIPIE